MVLQAGRAIKKVKCRPSALNLYRQSIAHKENRNVSHIGKAEVESFGPKWSEAPDQLDMCDMEAKKIPQFATDTLPVPHAPKKPHPLL